MEKTKAEYGSNVWLLSKGGREARKGILLNEDVYGWSPLYDSRRLPCDTG